MSKCAPLNINNVIQSDSMLLNQTTLTIVLIVMCKNIHKQWNLYIKDTLHGTSNCPVNTDRGVLFSEVETTFKV